MACLDEGLRSRNASGMFFKLNFKPNCGSKLGLKLQFNPTDKVTLEFEF